MKPRRKRPWFKDYKIRVWVILPYMQIRAVVIKPFLSQIVWGAWTDIGSCAMACK